MFSVKDTVWLIGVAAAIFMSWGMMSQRVTAMEKDVDRMETALMTFIKIESRIAVIETEVKNINQKLDDMKKKWTMIPITNFWNPYENMKGIKIPCILTQETSAPWGWDTSAWRISGKTERNTMKNFSWTHCKKICKAP